MFTPSRNVPLMFNAYNNKSLKLSYCLSFFDIFFGSVTDL